MHLMICLETVRAFPRLLCVVHLREHRPTFTLRGTSGKKIPSQTVAICAICIYRANFNQAEDPVSDLRFKPQDESNTCNFFPASDSGKLSFTFDIKLLLNRGLSVVEINMLVQLFLHKAHF